MRTWEEINKIKELLEKQGTPLPDHESDSDMGRSRLILYFNKYVIPENRELFINYIKSE